MASAWTGALRPTDTLARLGGDEFGLILPGLSAPEAQTVVERLKELVPGGQTFASGLVETDGAESIEDVLVRADAVLYASKTDRISARDLREPAS
jgi:GGDEF domain-containing protein